MLEEASRLRLSRGRSKHVVDGLHCLNVALIARAVGEMPLLILYYIGQYKAGAHLALINILAWHLGKPHGRTAAGR